jgi:cytochrome b subunit of formate dehydrogenase
MKPAADVRLPDGTRDSAGPESESTSVPLTHRLGHESAGERAPSGMYIERFDSFSRFLHILVIVSFLSLALTGMVIKFSDAEVFQFIARLLGGYEVTGFVHRVGAIITFTYFGLHLGYVVQKKRRRAVPWKDLLLGEDSLVPQKHDFIEFGRTVKWFLGLGPRPPYGRWTYWEKFDYFAVFWGVAIIGASGLVLWFPEFFTWLGLPGWMINVASIVHSDEALLAAGFIFTVHFFNTHFRPDKFPMDPVIFTGRVSLEELREERPREYALLIEAGELESRLVDAPPTWHVRWARVFGLSALGIGITIILLIIYSMIFV